MTRVLLVEDDEEIAKVIRFYLEEDGAYDVVWEPSAEDAERRVGEPFDIMLADIMLPGMDGVELCSRFREKNYCPVLFISCIDDEDVIIRALDMGGDDYLVKPFSNRVLRARIEANIRRASMPLGQQPSQYHFGEWTLDARRHQLSNGERTSRLNPTEYRLLTFFLDHPGQRFTTSSIYRLVWGKPSYGDVRTVMVYVCNLRKKIESDPNHPRYLHSARGEGYYFQPDGGKNDLWAGVLQG